MIWPFKKESEEVRLLREKVERELRIDANEYIKTINKQIEKETKNFEVVGSYESENENAVKLVVKYYKDKGFKVKLGITYPGKKIITIKWR